jgi:phospholipid transport system substrate-binding protein
LLVVFSLTVLGIAPAWAGPPTDELKSYVDRVVAILQDPDMKSPARAGERHRAIQAIANDGLDLTESARRALAPHWDTRTPSEQTRFIELFTALIYSSYLSRVAGYDGERLTYDGESVDGAEASVKTRVIAKDGDVTPVTFRLIQGKDGHWRVWDAVFEGMSLVGNYQAQFGRIIRSASFNELVKRLGKRPPTKN